MKIKNIKDVDGFFKVIDSCAGKVELITGGRQIKPQIKTLSVCFSDKLIKL